MCLSWGENAKKCVVDVVKLFCAACAAFCALHVALDVCFFWQAQWTWCCDGRLKKYGCYIQHFLQFLGGAGTMISSLFHPFHGVCGIYTFLWRSIWCRWCVAALQNRCRATKRLQGRDVWLCLCHSVFRCSMALLCSVDLSQVQHFRSVLHSVLLRHKFSTTLFSKL